MEYRQQLSLESGPIMAASQGVLAYRNQTHDQEDVLARPIVGFGLGSFMMGLILNIIAMLILHRGHLNQILEAGNEFLTRGVFLLGMTFVGSCLLLVTLKAWEDRAAVPLHARHWITCLTTGAIYSFALWGPGMLAERAIPVNLYAATIFWCIVIIFPVYASRWMVCKKILHHTERMVEAVRPIINGRGNHM